VEADAPPSRAQLGRAAVTWAAVSLADKLDTIVGLFAAGEKPTGSRDPYGLRRAAQGVLKILVDLEAVCGVSVGGVVSHTLGVTFSAPNSTVWLMGISRWEMRPVTLSRAANTAIGFLTVSARARPGAAQRMARQIAKSTIAEGPGPATCSTRRIIPHTL